MFALVIDMVIIWYYYYFLIKLLILYAITFIFSLLDYIILIKNQKVRKEEKNFIFIFALNLFSLILHYIKKEIS